MRSARGGTAGLATPALAVVLMPVMATAVETGIVAYLRPAPPIE